MAATFKAPLAKIAVAVVASFAGLTVPLQLLSQEDAIKTVKYYGYWLTLATCALYLWIIWREAHKVSIRQLRDLASRHSIGLILAGIIAFFLHAQTEPGFKILYDEHVLSSTAMNLHEHQLAYVQATGHVIEGETIASIGHVDKRPLLFPFILSIVHNAFGYNYEHVFALNAVLTFVALALLYGLLAQLTDRTYGWLGLLLFGSLPLLAQNATGGGYEILNLCLIIGLALSAIHYFRQEQGTAGLDLMIMTAILLANVRYESILYVLVPAAVFLQKSLRKRSMQLSWFSVLSPILLSVPLLSFALFRNEPMFIRTSQDNFFSLSHLPGNLVHAARYLFDWRGNYTNSLLLSIVGLAGILLFLFSFTPRFLKFTKSNDAVIILLPVAVIVLTNTLLALCNHWGAWTDPATSRFSLPLQFLMAVCPALVLNKLFHRATAPSWLMLLAGSYLLFVTPWHCDRSSQKSQLIIPEGYHWAMHWITNKAPPGNNLYIAQSATGIGLLQAGAIPFSVANSTPERVLHLKEIGIYNEIFAYEVLTVRDDGTTQPIPGSGALSARFNLETCAQYYLNDQVLYRISRLTAVKPALNGEEIPSKRLPPTIDIDRLQGADLYKVLPLTP
jgi:hypothetical protein